MMLCRHNGITVFRRLWAWIIPLVGAVAVFTFVLLTTPPGFRSIPEVLFSPPHGLSGDASAYALGAAASLALVCLVALGAVCLGLEVALERLKHVG
jgi:hypothetical protein